ncbi:hypothetical protein HAX54_035055 [Datura stramonium]|uniref:Uncharacterized protein n=1 Tax=Datura stramonium TaxID=4076 RepID=A0ABS8VGG5_DATST|nr:hypothetical protein [Datura stramonium]
MAKGVNETSVVEVGITQHSYAMTCMVHRHWQCMERRGTPHFRHYEQCSVPQVASQPEGQIPVRLETEAAKPNFNLRRNDEGLICYYTNPLLTRFRRAILEIIQLFSNNEFV